MLHKIEIWNVKHNFDIEPLTHLYILNSFILHKASTVLIYLL